MSLDLQDKLTRQQVFCNLDARHVLVHKLATSYMWLFQLKLIITKQKLKVQFLNHPSHISDAQQPHVLVATILDKTDVEHAQLHRQLSWKALI